MKFNKVPIIFIIPMLVLYLVRVIFPMLTAFWYSFHNTDGISKMIFVGLRNYKMIISDESFLKTIFVTIKYSVFMVGAGQLVALILALLLAKSSRLNVFFKSLFFMPTVLSMVAVAFIWKIVFSYGGPLDFLLDSAGLSAIKLGWLTDPKYALYSIVIVGVFKGAGMGMILYISALLSIPGEIYEASEIDGAGKISKFFKVTLPLLIPGISISVINATIHNLREFEKMLILTNGGPMESTTTVGLFIIEKALNSLWVGYASATAIILFIFIAFITFWQNRFFDDRTVHY